MLSITTLYNKNSFIKQNGDVIVDLTKASLEYNKPVKYKSIIIVTYDYVMRPDLIAKATIGDANKLDYILKFNGISNPFSIDVGDILLIPDENEMGAIFKTPDIDDDDAIKKSKVSIVTITSTKDEKRLAMLQAMANKKDILPPNINKPGDQNIKYKDGKIIFGEDITSINKNNCPDTLSRAKLKEKLLTNKIFK
jgi:hypothetical protein